MGDIKTSFKHVKYVIAAATTLLTFLQLLLGVRNEIHHANVNASNAAILKEINDLRVQVAAKK